MKKIFTLLLLFVVFTTSAQDDLQRRTAYYESSFSDLTISSLTDNSFAVYIDGRVIRSGYNFEVSIDRIKPGMHSLKIIQRLPYAKVGNMVFKTDKIIYDSDVFIRSNTQTHFIISDYGRVSKSVRSNRTYGNYWPSYSYGYGYGYSPMNNNSFSQLKQTVNNSSFESDKVMMVKQVITSNYFTVKQVKEILRLFNFESSKLEIAKLIYPKTIDNQNFFSVFDEFSYSSSKQELNQYIMNNRG